MATPWDRAAKGYVEEWVPRFVPYHLDLIKELKLQAGERVLVTCSGPGAEVLACARAVGEHGHVRATDESEEMVKLCCAQLEGAGFAKQVECVQADASDVTGQPWDAIVCAFGLWQFSDRAKIISAWGGALGPHGKVGVLTWGPAEEDDPFERIARCLAHSEPDYVAPSPRIPAEREAMEKMFEEAGLVMVRHTVVRHTLAFKRAEDFVTSLREACTWRKIWEEIGDERIGRIAARFYGLVGGPDAPLTWTPPATLAIAAFPGADVAVESRSHIKVPTIPPSRNEL